MFLNFLSVIDASIFIHIREKNLISYIHMQLNLFLIYSSYCEIGLYPTICYMYSHHWDMYSYQITSFVPRQVHACHSSRMYLPWSISEVNCQRRLLLEMILFIFLEGRNMTHYGKIVHMTKRKRPFFAFVNHSASKSQGWVVQTEYKTAEYVSISQLVVVHCICTNLSFFSVDASLCIV